MSKIPKIKKQIPTTCMYNIFLVYFFGLRWNLPFYPEIFTVLHNDPAVPQDHCGKCQILKKGLITLFVQY